MSKELWIVIAAIVILLAPFALSKLGVAEEQLLGWAENALQKSTATTHVQQNEQSGLSYGDPLG